MESTVPLATVATPSGQPLRVRDLFNELGEARLQALSQEFYDRVYADDEEPWFRDMFAETAATPKDLAVFSQLCFFVQRFGGDPYYGGLQKDSAFIREIHSHFRITPRGYERWMHHMRNALEVVDLGPRADEVREVMVQYFSAFGKSTINAKTDGAEAQRRPRTSSLREEIENDKKQDKKDKKKKKKKAEEKKKEKKEKKKKEKTNAKEEKEEPKEKKVE